MCSRHAVPFASRYRYVTVTFFSLSAEFSHFNREFRQALNL